MPVQEEIRIKVAWKGREADIGLERLREEFKRLEARTKGANSGLGGVQGHLSGILTRLGPLGPAAFSSWCAPAVKYSPAWGPAWAAGAFGVTTV